VKIPVVYKEVILIILGLLFSDVSEADTWQEQRMDMLEEVQADMKAVTGSALSAPVAQALANVERHKFIPNHLRQLAYENKPLPIGREQTISQPFIVAIMTELLEPEDTDLILEIGTGSGYQAAVLAKLVNRVYSVEIIESLAVEATNRLRALGYFNVSVRHGDGMKGWPGIDRFDGIIVTAAGIEIPVDLLEKLKPGGKLVMPVGEIFADQQLKVIERTDNGFIERDVLPVRFVPVTSEVR
jgi:protein-L-isoaspartate(D-aspartate) O-methyltransferase